MLLDELQVTIPEDRRAQIAAAAKVLGDGIAGKVPFAPGVQPVSNDPVELLINSTWRATLAVTGADGLPPVQLGRQRAAAGDRAKLSLRLPPTCEPKRARPRPCKARSSAIRLTVRRCNSRTAAGDGGLERAALRALAGGIDHGGLTRGVRHARR